MSVQCIDCVNFNAGENIPHPFGPPDHYRELCDAPENLKTDYRGEVDRRISTPKIINKHNNCVWFLALNPSSSSSSSSEDDPSNPVVTSISVVDADLIDGKVSVTHNLGLDYPLVQVYNNVKQLVIMGVTSIDSNTIEVDFDGYVPLVGTWRIIIKR